MASKLVLTFLISAAAMMPTYSAMTHLDLFCRYLQSDIYQKAQEDYFQSLPNNLNHPFISYSYSDSYKKFLIDELPKIQNEPIMSSWDKKALKICGLFASTAPIMYSLVKMRQLTHKQVKLKEIEAQFKEEKYKKELKHKYLEKLMGQKNHSHAVSHVIKDYVASSNTSLENAKLSRSLREPLDRLANRPVENTLLSGGIAISCYALGAGSLILTHYLSNWIIKKNLIAYCNEQLKAFENKNP